MESESELAARLEGWAESEAARIRRHYGERVAVTSVRPKELGDALLRIGLRGRHGVVWLEDVAEFGEEVHFVAVLSQVGGPADLPHGWRGSLWSAHVALQAAHTLSGDGDGSWAEVGPESPPVFDAGIVAFAADN